MEARLGIISPTGEFHPCGFGCHVALCEKMGGETKIIQSAKQFLEDNGWLMVEFFAISQVFGILGTPNVAQQDTIDQLVMAWEALDDNEFVDVFNSNPEGLKRESCVDKFSCDKAFRESVMAYHSTNLQKPTRLITPPVGMNTNYRDVNKRLNGD